MSHMTASPRARPRGNPALPTGGRLYARAAAGFRSGRAFDQLRARRGASAAAAYAIQRERGCMSVVEALVAARIQARSQGATCAEGLLIPGSATQLPRFDALVRRSSTAALSDLEQAVLELHVAVAGYRIEGPGDPADPDLAGRFWWTLGRSGWSGYEVSSGDWDAREDALRDAARLLQREAGGRCWRSDWR